MSKWIRDIFERIIYYVTAFCTVICPYICAIGILVAIVVLMLKYAEYKAGLFINDLTQNGAFNVSRNESDFMYEILRAHEIVVVNDKSGLYGENDFGRVEALNLDDAYHMKRWTQRFNKAKNNDINTLLMTLNEIIGQMEKRLKVYTIKEEKRSQVDKFVNQNNETFLQEYDDFVFEN